MSRAAATFSALLSLALLGIAGCDDGGTDATTACRKDPQSCSAAALEAMKSDPDEGITLLEIGCEAGRRTACHNLALALELHRPSELPRSAEVFRRNCKAGHSSSCTALGIDYAYGRGVEHDRDQALRLLTVPCENEDVVEACLALGAMFKDGAMKGTVPLEVAVPYLDRACRLGRADGCTHAGLLLLNSKGVGTDPRAARVRLKKGCDGGDALGCAGLRQIMP